MPFLILYVHVQAFFIVSDPPANTRLWRLFSQAQQTAAILTRFYVGRATESLSDSPELVVLERLGAPKANFLAELRKVAEPDVFEG